MISGEVISIKKYFLIIVLLLVLIYSALAPISMGYNFNRSIQKELISDYSDEIDWWPMFRHDVMHSGYSSSKAPNTENVIWIYSTGDNIWSSPAVVDGKLFIGSWDNKIYCLDAESGVEEWNYTTGDYVFSSPAVYENRIYIGSDDNNLYCLNASSGNKIWNYTTGDRVKSSPAIVDGRVYFGSDDFNVYCLNADNGSKIWKFTTGYSISESSPAISYGNVYIGSNEVYCINATNGNLEWSNDPGGPDHWDYRSSPLVIDGRVYVGHDYDGLYCLDAYSGMQLWSYWTGETMVSSPAFNNGNLCFGSNDGYIHCLDSISGNKKWAIKLGDILISSPAIADGKVYVGSRNRIYCLLAVNGNEIWSHGMGQCISSPAVADGKVYVGSYDGNVYCFGEGEENEPPYAPDIWGPSTGKPDMEHNYTFSTIDPDGHEVYYFIDWNDSTYEEWIGPYFSGLDVIIGHNWTEQGTYLIKTKVMDIYGADSDWSTFQVSIPRTRASQCWLGFLERYPIIKEVFLRLIQG
jgi:outer membrane protein assembly factor BamB